MLDIGLRYRILLLFLCLIVMTSITTITAVLFATNTNVEEQAQDKLQVGIRVFQQLLNLQAEQLYDSAELLTADFGFKTAMLDDDSETILSVLKNHSARISADLMMLVSLDGALVASTDEKTHLAKDFPFQELLVEADDLGGLTTVVTLNGNAYQLVILQIEAPLPVAWTVIGFQIDQSLVNQLKDLTSLDVAFTVAGERKPVLTTGAFEMVKATIQLSDGEWQRVSASGEDYLAVVLNLSKSNKFEVNAVLTTSLDAAYAKFSQLKAQMFIIAIIALLISTLVAMIFSRNITRPVFKLVSAAKRISSGDYSEDIPLANTKRNEIDQLASSFQVMQRGIAEREEKIIQHAYHDSLTGLGNRRLAKQQIDKQLHYAESKQGKFAIACIDIKSFKQINDTFGYQIGDELLKAIGQKLLSISSQEVKPARIGADEFILFLQDASLDESKDSVSNKLNQLNDLYSFDGLNVLASIVAGVAYYPDHGTETDQLLRRADIALNEAKEKKLELTVYENGSEEKYLSQVRIVNELKSAISKDQLTIFYQPKLDLQQQKVTQVESLVRWFHPELGPIHPADFIPLAEQSGLMPDLSRWIMRRALQEGAAWRDQNIDFAIAINLSAHDLVSADLPEYVMGILDECGLKPKDLIIEVTESAVMEDLDKSLLVLNEFRENGIKLAIDDYGTGYSSLSQLKKLPVDELKIDMAFVLHLDKNKEDQAIVRSTIELARDLGLTVVAEGVDNRTSWAILEQFGCDKLQGFYISKPLASADLIAWHSTFDIASEYEGVANLHPTVIDSTVRKVGNA